MHPDPWLSPKKHRQRCQSSPRWLRYHRRVRLSVGFPVTPLSAPSRSMNDKCMTKCQVDCALVSNVTAHYTDSDSNQINMLQRAAQHRTTIVRSCYVRIGCSENTRPPPNFCLMLGQHLRGWSDIKPTLVQVLVLLGHLRI